MGGREIKHINDVERDPSQEALVCRLLYEPVLANLLNQYPFNFSTVGEPLALISKHERRRSAYEYVYPAKAIRIWAVLPAEDIGWRPATYERLSQIVMDYQVGLNSAGIKVIYCHIPQAYVHYSVLPQDPAVFSPAFVSAFTWTLAAELALSLAGDKETYAMLTQQAMLAVEQAKAASARESQLTLPDPGVISIREKSYDFPLG
jgi:hypothetical protein